MHGILRKENDHEIRLSNLLLDPGGPVGAHGDEVVDENVVIAAQRLEDFAGDWFVRRDIAFVTDENPGPRDPVRGAWSSLRGVVLGVHHGAWCFTPRELSVVWAGGRWPSGPGRNIQGGRCRAVSSAGRRRGYVRLPEDRGSRYC